VNCRFVQSWLGNPCGLVVGPLRGLVHNHPHDGREGQGRVPTIGTTGPVSVGKGTGLLFVPPLAST